MAEVRQMFGRVPARVESILDGVGYTFPLPDGSVVSVIRHRGSYGGPQGLWEAAVVEAEDVIWGIEGWLTEDEVSAYLDARGA